MTVTTQRTTDPTTATATTGPQTTDRPVVEPHHGRRLAVLVGGLAVVTAATLGTWAVVASRTSPAPQTAAPVAVAPWTTGYAAGSATYDEQVPTVVTPDHQGWPGPRSEWPTGTTVPRAVQGDRSWAEPSTVGAAGNGWTGAYGPGSATYDEQVAAGRGDRSWADGYGPGSTTYDEQVPSSLPAQGDWSSY